MSETQFLDLDALRPLGRSLNLEGVEHFMVPLSVDGWLANLKLVDDMQKSFKDNPDITPAQIAEANLATTVATLHRGFPTISPEQFRQMPMHYLDAITLFVRSFDGSDNADKEVALEAENPPAPPSEAKTD